MKTDKIEYTDKEREEKLRKLRQEIFKGLDKISVEIIKKYFPGMSLYEIIALLEIIKYNILRTSEEKSKNDG